MVYIQHLISLPAPSSSQSIHHYYRSSPSSLYAIIQTSSSSYTILQTSSSYTILQTSSLFPVWSGTFISMATSSTPPTTVQWCGTICRCSGSSGRTACSHCVPSMRPSTDRDVSTTTSHGCSTTSSTKYSSGDTTATALCDMM